MSTSFRRRWKTLRLLKSEKRNKKDEDQLGYIQTSHSQSTRDPDESTKYWNADSIGTPTDHRLPPIDTDSRSLIGSWESGMSSAEESPRLVRTLSRHISMQFRGEVSPATTLDSRQQEIPHSNHDIEDQKHGYKDPLSVITDLNWMEFEPRR